MADTTSLSALPQNNDVQNSENITLQTNEISSQGGVNGGGQPVQSSMQEPQPTNTKQANPLQYVPPNSQQQQPPEQLSQNMINQVINGIQQASKTGGTELPSRDIPINPGRITQDEQVQPNFVPEVKNPQQADYIKKHELESEVESKQIQNERVNSKLDNLYDEIQTPLLIGVLFFIFQLPFFGKFIRKNFQSLYTNDGNINMYGYLFKATLFSGIYYSLQKGMRHLSEY